MLKGEILFVPSIQKGWGTGHLRRCINLAEEIGGVLLLSGNREEWVEEIFASHREKLKRADKTEGLHPPFILIDKRKTSRKEVAFLKTIAPVVALDEGGGARVYIDYLIDTLPNLKQARNPGNLSSPGFLDLPSFHEKKKLSDIPVAEWKVLVAFGGEDPARLSSRVTAFLVSHRFFTPGQVTVIPGTASEGDEFPRGITILPRKPCLKERLPQWDLVICSFGLTAYESAAVGSGVLLVNPTRYHRRLSRLAGFPEAGLRQVQKKCLKYWLLSPQKLSEKVKALIPEERESTGAVIRELEPPKHPGCPVCGRGMNRAIGRFPDRTFFRCGNCSLVYQLRFHPHGISYGKDYFFREYEKQYGKSYLDDFEHISTMSKPRLKILESLTGRPGRILDVGCAYGPFLAEAKVRGWIPAGMDVSEEGIRHVQEKLGINAVYGDFLESAVHFPEGAFDVVTLWYVIEHFEELDRVLKMVSRLLPAGGIFAFSTPNLTGISGRKDLSGFLRKSPADHSTIWSPAIARRLLPRYGLRIRRIRITGHHPERFPGVSSNKPGLMKTLAGIISPVAGLGDTFEVYAVKKGSNR
jgi:2-polyprenyl-3-methyl-5-hydroxy-6-metoxy-1,4-benzoquinol methylase/spore coat polysaccharide biosynthesis predicted glycosyltransferase SpsG